MNSCSKSNEEVSESIRSSTDMVSAELTFSRLLLLARHVSPVGNDFSNIDQYTCAQVDSISGDTSTFPSGDPITVHLSFPDTGCVDIDSRLKRGPISITYFDDLSNVGAVAELTFDGFSGGPNRIRGSVNLAHSSASSYSVAYVSCEMFSGSFSMFYFGNAIFTHVVGSSTEDPLDDEYMYTSTIEGTDSEDRDFIVNATTPIELSTSCAWNVAGSFSMEPSDRSKRFINYGNGDCDEKVTVTASGQDINIFLP